MVAVAAAVVVVAAAWLLLAEGSDMTARKVGQLGADVLVGDDG